MFTKLVMLDWQLLGTMITMTVQVSFSQILKTLYNVIIDNIGNIQYIQALAQYTYNFTLTTLKSDDYQCVIWGKHSSALEAVLPKCKLLTCILVADIFLAFPKA